MLLSTLTGISSPEFHAGVVLWCAQACRSGQLMKTEAEMFCHINKTTAFLITYIFLKRIAPSWPINLMIVTTAMMTRGKRKSKMKMFCVSTFKNHNFFWMVWWDFLRTQDPGASQEKNKKHPTLTKRLMSPGERRGEAPWGEEKKNACHFMLSLKSHFREAKIKASPGSWKRLASQGQEFNWLYASFERQHCWITSHTGKVISIALMQPKKGCIED